MIEKLIEQQETIKGMQENEESAIKIMKMYEDYKLRVDKAIEYIEEKEEILLNCDEEWLDHDEMIDKKRFEKILEILKGGKII